MGLVVDSSVLIASERGLLDVHARLQHRETERVAISAVTASELLHGMHRAAAAVIRRRRQSFVERILATIEVLPFDLVAARVHASLWAEMAAKGINVGPHDLIIAATALANGCSVATRDNRRFPKVPGLKCEIWA